MGYRQTAQTGRGRRFMTDSQKESGWKFLQAIALACVPVLSTCIGFIYSSLQDHATKLAVIESTRYTSQDAERDRKAFQVEMKALMRSYDPGPLRAQMYDLGIVVARIDNQVSDLARRADAAERDGKNK